MDREAVTDPTPDRSRASAGSAGAPPRWLVVLTVLFALGLVGVVALANSGAATTELLRLAHAIPGRDKTVHFFLMGTMALLLNLTWRADCWKLGPVPVLKGSVVVAIVVTLEELSQWFVAHRNFSLEDLAYDYFGILVLGQLAMLLRWSAGRSR